MNDRKSVDEFLDAVSQLVEMTKSKDFQKVEKFPDYFDEVLTLLERYVQLFKLISTKSFGESGITPEEIQQSIQAVDQLPSREKRLLTRIKDTKEDVEKERARVELQKSMLKKQAKQKGRKKKFDRSGARKDWKPL